MPSLIFPRESILEKAGGVRESFSSWDNCMAKTYCKWPVIVGIVVGSLVIFSILFCVVRCCCCGLQCCCGIFSCCNACCPSPRGKGYKNQDSVPPPQPYHQSPAQYQKSAQYGAPAPMQYDNRPQFATFDSSKNVNEDSLPAMPSWDSAHSRKVEVAPEAHEMRPMDMNSSPGAAAAALSHNSPYRGDGYGAGVGRQSPGTPGMDTRNQAASYYAGAGSVAGSDGWGHNQRSDNLNQYGMQGQESGVYGQSAPYGSAPYQQQLRVGSASPPGAYGAGYGGHSSPSPSYGRHDSPSVSYPSDNRAHDEPAPEPQSFVNPSRPGQFADDHARRPANGGYRDV
ncbi:hypothetical protein P152DRAFT_449414 [Eremomyces bilateralis CBS 781.70]|uniref:Fibroin-3 related protein n=1 Tax=Eremomyces bilateralis CBS 781.70 TaxID=1392243 RepID=A0A6G1G3R8_9PEZI|nr:uncharacterized protein P152DRAFT_449414 [Eremomyces bilateralis CBS 781.70]KAF1812714.1 hypothetical protein P152DRAFT_449414 [Eremomyces bilateralis CBS 781.70]